MTDYRKILILRSKKCSQREMERNKVASRETSKVVFETADRLAICWPIDDDITNTDLERSSFRTNTKVFVCTLSRIIRTSTVSLQSPALR